MLHSKGLFLYSLNIKAREFKARVFVIEVPGSVLSWDLLHGTVHTILR